MGTYYKKTMKSRFFRDSSLDQSSRELERQNVRIMRMQNQFNTIAAYRYEMNMKNALMEKIKAEYPEMVNYS